MEHKYLVGSVCACFFCASFSSNAALVTGDVLEFSSNSYFALDSNANGIFDLAEQISISMDEGIRIGAIQIASAVTAARLMAQNYPLLMPLGNSLAIQECTQRPAQ